MARQRRFVESGLHLVRPLVAMLAAWACLNACSPQAVGHASEAGGSIEGFIRERLTNNDWLCGLYGSEAEKKDVFRFSRNGSGYLVATARHGEPFLLTSTLTVSFRWSVSDSVLTLSDQKVQSYVAKAGNAQPIEMKDLLTGRSVAQWFTVEFSGPGLLLFAERTFACQRR